MEVISLSNAQLGKVGHPWERTFMNLFFTFDNKVIKQCQFYTNVLPMYQYYAIRKISFLSNLQMTQNQVLQTLHDSFAKIELLKCASMFKCEVNIISKTFRTIIRDQFRNEVGR